MSEDGGRVSQADRLVELARGSYMFGVSAAKEPFALPREGPPIVRMLRGGESLRAALAAAFAQEVGKVPSSASLTDALLVIEGEAQQAGNGNELFVRVGERDGIVYLDLGDATGRAVAIGPAGWNVIDRPPVLFRRSELTKPLPVPEHGGDLDELSLMMHLTDKSWELIEAWLVAALFPGIAHPILLLLGPQDAGKSSTARYLASVVDPSEPALRAAPRDEQGWAVSAAGSWIVPTDNLSGIAPWFSDALCRASTGEGFLRRRLYTDDGLSVLRFRRCVILNSIDPGALRGDLADRVLLVGMEQLDDGDRMVEGVMDRLFATAHARILGGLCDLAVQVLGALPDTWPRRLPRLADFGRICAAVDAVRGTDTLNRYCALRRDVAIEVVDADVVAERVRDLAEPFEGEAQQLLDLLTSRLPNPDRPPRDWPTSARKLSGDLRRAAGPLAALGVDVQFSRPGGRRLITIRRRGEGAQLDLEGDGAA